MNCLKCPIGEGCQVSKMTMQTEYMGTISVPVKVEPTTADECPLIRLLSLLADHQK